MSEESDWIMDRAKFYHIDQGMKPNVAVRRASDDWNKFKARGVNPPPARPSALQQALGQQGLISGGGGGGRYQHQQVGVNVAVSKEDAERILRQKGKQEEFEGKTVFQFTIRFAGSEIELEYAIPSMGGWKPMAEEMERLMFEAVKDPNSSVDSVRMKDTETGRERKAERFRPSHMRW